MLIIVIGETGENLEIKREKVEAAKLKIKPKKTTYLLAVKTRDKAV